MFSYFFTFGTVAVAPVALIYPVFNLFRKHWATSLCLLLIATVLVFINPVANMFILADIAKSYRMEMQETAEKENCDGRPIVWLRERFGEPYKIVANGDGEEWW